MVGHIFPVWDQIQFVLLRNEIPYCNLQPWTEQGAEESGGFFILSGIDDLEVIQPLAGPKR